MYMSFKIIISISLFEHTNNCSLNFFHLKFICNKFFLFYFLFNQILFQKKSQIVSNSIMSTSSIASEIF